MGVQHVLTESDRESILGVVNEAFDDAGRILKNIPHEEKAISEAVNSDEVDTVDPMPGNQDGDDTIPSPIDIMIDEIASAIENSDIGEVEDADADGENGGDGEDDDIEDDEWSFGMAGAFIDSLIDDGKLPEITEDMTRDEENEFVAKARSMGVASLAIEFARAQYNAAMEEATGSKKKRIRPTLKKGDKVSGPWHDDGEDVWGTVIRVYSERGETLVDVDIDGPRSQAGAVATIPINQIVIGRGA